MAIVMESAKLSVPVPPVMGDNVPLEIQQYIIQVHDYLNAVSRDLKKIGDLV